MRGITFLIGVGVGGFLYPVVVGPISQFGISPEIFFGASIAAAVVIFFLRVSTC